jgi:acetyltransferase-like isoleucine patch superfamily enzyme
MGRVRQILDKIHYHIKPSDSVKLARKMGVRFTAASGQEHSLILSEPYGVFGSEPYLITIGEHVEITYGVRFITHDGAIWSLRKYDERFQELDLLGPIKVGNNVFIGNNSIILPNVTIGDNTIIAGQYYIIVTNHGTKAGELIRNQPDDVAEDGIYIGEDVWIAAQCVILKGAKINNGAIIGAKSLVNSEIPANAIAVGVPAKVIGYRKL